MQLADFENFHLLVFSYSLCVQLSKLSILSEKQGDGERSSRVSSTLCMLSVFANTIR